MTQTEYKNLSELMIKENKKNTNTNANEHFDNLLTYITYMSNTYTYLKKFIEILTIIKKIQILKNDKYDLLIPTESEINLLEQNLKNVNTMDIIATLSRLIKSKAQSFKIFLDTKYLIQKLNNGSTIYYRYFVEKKKKDKKIDISDTDFISNITMNIIIKNENYNEIYEQLNMITDKLIKINAKSENLYLLEGSNNKKNNEILYYKYIKEQRYKKINNSDDGNDDSDDNSDSDNDNDDDNDNDILKSMDKQKNMTISYRNNFFSFIINKFYKNNKSNNTYLNKIKNIILTNLNLKKLTEGNEHLYKTLSNFFKHQVNSLVLITVLLQPFSIVEEDYIFKLKEINELNIKSALSNKSSKKTLSNNKQKDENEDNDPSVSLFNKVSCIKLIKKFMKDSTPYNNNSLTNLINHYYTIMENKENAHKLLWLLFNIYYLECIYNEFKNNSSSTFETYTRLLAVKPVKSGDPYLERLKWIIKLFEEQKNTEMSLLGLINFCLFISLKEENSYLLFGDDSDLDFDDLNESEESNDKSQIYF
jgi:hypothetical protein